MLVTDSTTFVAWRDSWNGTLALPAEGAYMATVIHEQEPGAEEAVLSDSVFLGLAVGLVKAVLAVFAVSRPTSRPADP